jgi:putative SOS response-associated peptidase YedK
MCGRYTLIQSRKLFAETFGVQPSLFESYNIAPTQYAPVIWQPEASRELLSARWGLIPRWVQKPADFKANLFNARAETVGEKPSFKRPFTSQRCIVPASGFYEWKSDGGSKQPYYIQPKDTPLLAFAGLYDHWQQDDSEIYSYTIITTAANPFMAALHERMPVMLDAADFEQWLSPESEPEALESLLVPYMGELTAHPVDKRVGRVRENDAELIQATQEQPVA